MATLSREYRKQLERVIIEARKVGEKGATNALKALAVEHHEPLGGSSQAQRDLRNRLRAHGRQLGDKLDPKRGTQTIHHLASECAYEHWHRMLFARFLAENNLLIEPESGVALSLDECRELAREQNADWLELASSFAVRMLPQIFRQGDPVLEVSLPPETRKNLEELLEGLPAEVFAADDSLGWVYQFWQTEQKQRVNDSGEKIGADELPAVTQLFTEDYMVLFLLHNTLGAWWTAKRKAEGIDQALPGYEWTYLRLKEDGTPAAGDLEGWPRLARDIKVLDPSMGSGHFLVFALPILVGFRMEEEGLSQQEAVKAVLRDNLFGLELDNRCTQIAAFNLAFAAWRMCGGVTELPQLNLACSGLGINAKEEDWVKLAGDDARAQETMTRLYHLFAQAPVLGSLIDPTRVGGNLFTAEFHQVQSLLEEALMEQKTETGHELAVTAKGVFEAAKILADTFTLVATNVPYLSMRRQNPAMRSLIKDQYRDGKACLSTAFLQRLIAACEQHGVVAAVTPQHWLFQPSYKELRSDLLKRHRWSFVATLGTGAFETISGEVVNVTLIGLEKSRYDDRPFTLIDASLEVTPAEKAKFLQIDELNYSRQSEQMRNPEARVMSVSSVVDFSLDNFAEAPQGIITGDLDHWQRCFWELPAICPPWIPFLSTTSTSAPYTAREHVVDWSGAPVDFIRPRPGNKAMGRRGVAVSQMSDLAVTLYTGEAYDGNVAPIVPFNEALVPALWEFVNSADYRPALRRLDRAGKLTNGTLLKISFDEAHWKAIAQQTFKGELPAATSQDPTQWLFDAVPKASHLPLQVAIARLVGYEWPRQTGSSFMDCPALGPDELEGHADDDGIVCLASIQGEAPAADRLRALLADAYGVEWSATKQAELLAEVGYAGKSLEDWLRDGFFEQHCNLFHNRPFVWHIWDGQRDGFHALVNYHKLAAPNGDGRRTLEKLTYGYLGDWITRQRADQSNGVEGADARVAAAVHLQSELKKIIEGEPPYDIFVRWKPLHEQPIGWEPDINDGVRLNIRPFMTAKALNGRGKGSSILRILPKGIKWDKDRGKEPHRSKEDFPWFWSWDGQTQDFKGGREFDGNRWNDLHYSIQAKKEARERQRETQSRQVTKK